MPAAIFIGNSHLVAVEAAYKARIGGKPRAYFLQLHDAQFGETLVDGHPHGVNRAIVSRLEGLMAGDPEITHLFSSFRGSMHVGTSLFQQPRVFDVMLPDRPDLPFRPGAELIPYSVFYEELCRRLAIQRPYFNYIGALAGLKATEIEIPPAIPDEAHILQYPGAFRDKVAPGIFSAPVLRYKFWRTATNIARQMAAQAGMAYLPSPPAALTAMGDLKPEYWARDALHASTVYGSLVLDQVIGLMHGKGADHGQSL